MTIEDKNRLMGMDSLSLNALWHDAKEWLFKCPFCLKPYNKGAVKCHHCCSEIPESTLIKHLDLEHLLIKLIRLRYHFEQNKPSDGTVVIISLLLFIFGGVVSVVMYQNIHHWLIPTTISIGTLVFVFLVIRKYDSDAALQTHILQKELEEIEPLFEQFLDKKNT